MPRITFRSKLTFLFIVILIAQGILIGIFSYYYDKDITIKNKNSDMLDIVNNIDININEKIRNTQKLLLEVSDSNITKNFIVDGENEESREYFNLLESSLSIANHIVITTKDNILYTKNRNDEILEESKINLGYILAEQNKDKVIWLGLNDEEDKTDLIVSSSIKDEEENVIGAIIVELDSDIFSSLLFSSQNTFQQQYTFIVDKKGDLIAKNKQIDKLWVNEIYERFNEGDRSFSMEWEDNSYLVRGQYNGITGWVTFSVISMNNIFTDVGTISRLILFIILISTIFLSIVAGIIFYSMTKPINDLTKGMKEVEKGDYSVHVEPKGKDEIGDLIRAFNFMVEKINELVQKVYKGRLARKDAELKALQAQINPHFLYNTLDSINWMLIDKGEYQISNIIVSLGNLMKYSIANNNGIVYLEDELKHIENYLLIQKNRLEDKLEYRIAVPDDLLKVKLPKLIIQPLVENAIIHGIEPMDRKGYIEIKGENRLGELILSVYDNGVGIKESELNVLKETLYENDSNKSIGIYNVAHRIELQYGKQYKMIIESKENEGTLIKLVIPIN